MLTNRRLYNRIDEIIDNAYLGFLFALLGAEMLTETQKRQVEQLGLVIGARPILELLYILVRNRPDAGYPADFPLSKLLDQVASLGTLPVINDAQQATVDTGRAAFMDAIETAKQEIKKQIRQRLVELNREHRQHVAVHRVTSVHDTRNRKDALIASFLALIPLILKAARESFDRSLASVMTDTINDAVVDTATSESLMTGVSPKNTIVFKKVMDDESLCKWCRKFYCLADGSPRLFRLEELQANGSNYGKPKSEWKPVLGKTHVRCRCELFIRKSS